MLKAIHDLVPGRIRFKVQGLYRGEPLRRHLETELGRESCIIMVKASTRTGSLLVRYKAEASPAVIFSFILAKVAEFQREKDPDPATTPAASPSNSDPSPRRHVPAVPAEASTPATIPAKRPLPATSVIPAPFAASAQAVLKTLGVEKAEGLHFDEARQRLREYGQNLLPEARSRSSWDILKAQLLSGPVALLALAAGVSALTGGLLEAVAIMAVVGLNAAIGYATESQSERTINSLRNMITPRACVLRDGMEEEIDVKGLVPGDIISLRPGDFVGADARIVEATRLSIDESALTGESVPARKNADFIANDDTPLADRRNMCYRGTLVTGGQGVAVVIDTGARTEVSQIQRLVNEAESGETPMTRQLARLGGQLVWVAGGLCSLVFLLGLLRGTGILSMLKTSLSLAVAAVPEGLPAVATTALALGVRRMKSRGVLIRQLGAIEALGATQVMCLDKTGTITANRMTIVRLHAGDAAIPCQEEKIPFSIPREDHFSHELPLLLVAVALCNESELVGTGDGVRLVGSPTENALVQLALDCGIDVDALRREYVLQKMYHRSENRNYMISVHDDGRGSTVAAVKGSPSEVLALCGRVMLDGRVEEMTAARRARLQRENEAMGGEALRVLGVAVGTGAADIDLNRMAEVLALDYIWVGMVAMTDPIRRGVRKLMDQFHRAGIKTVMITGDQSATAYTVGKELGLNGSGPLQISDSSSMTRLDPAELSRLCDKTNVFARVSPSNKLHIVEAYQHGGKVVAMTGDGINDGPALKKADIGVAMGRTGTDVAREIADVVLEDDQLETMIVAIEEGRTIYLNVRKSLHFLLATNFSEILVALGANAAGLGQPLTQMQLLWINMVSDIFPGLALSLEPVEDDILLQPPRDTGESILRKQDLKTIATEASILGAGAMASYAYGLGRYGVGPRASSLSFLSLTLGQLLHAYHCRSEKYTIFGKGPSRSNRYLDWAIWGSIALQLVAMMVPGLRSILGIRGVSLLDAMVVGGTALAPLFVNDLLKKGRSAPAVLGPRSRQVSPGLKGPLP